MIAFLFYILHYKLPKIISNYLKQDYSMERNPRERMFKNNFIQNFFTTKIHPNNLVRNGIYIIINNNKISPKYFGQFLSKDDISVKFRVLPSSTIFSENSTGDFVNEYYSFFELNSNLPEDIIRIIAKDLGFISG